MTSRISIPQDQIEKFYRKHRIKALALVGSVLRNDFRPDSDVDVLVEFEPGTRLRFYELFDMQAELSVILGRKVDLVEKRLVKRSENYIRRRNILSQVEPVYVAR
jgi:predicted nucleotidyltransferase